jgi:hypothetical protein
MASIERIISMKRLIFIISLLLFTLTLFAEGPVTVTLSGGLNDNPPLRDKMAKELSTMLTEINAAQASNRDLDFHTMNVSSNVSRSMAMLWENTPFVCTDAEIVGTVLTTGTGYQVRNIPLMMKPTGDRAFNEEEYQEAVVSFDKSGDVESFYLAISMNLYMNVIKSNLQLTDLRRRQLILDYVEQFRTAYNQKDINFLEQVFSDDALIITGRVIMQKHEEGFATPEVKYNKQSKQQYLKNLRATFSRAKYIHVTFDDIEVMRHPTNPNFYGVTLHQGYTSSNYHDDGYLFLLWDFTDESKPQVHVRTWQPDKIGDKPLPKDKVFSLSDFDI